MFEVRVNCLPKWAMQGIILLLGCLAYALTFFHRYAPSVLYDKIAATLHVPTDKVSEFGSMYFWPYAVMQPIGGILADVFSPGKLISIAVIIISIGATINALTDNFGVASLGRFLVGLGAGPIFVPASRLVASWFTDRGFVIASGILLAAGAAGGMIAQGPLSAMVGDGPWQNAFYIAAAVGVIIAVFSFLLLKATPSYAGYVDDRSEESVAPDTKSMSFKEQMVQLWVNIKIVMTNRQFWFCAIWGTCSPSCFFNLSSMWAVPYLQDVLHLPKSTANMYIMMLSLSWVIGSPGFSVITDIIKTRKYILFFGAIISCGTSIGFMFVTENTPIPLLLFMLFMFALFAGATIGVDVTMNKEMNIDSAAATGMGCGNFFPFFTSGILQLITPVILKAIDGQNSTHTPEAYKYGLWLVNAILTAIAAVGAFLARDTYKLPPELKAGYQVAGEKQSLFQTLA